MLFFCFSRIVEDEEPMHEDFHKPQAFFDQVHDGIVLPLEICDHLLQTMVAEGLDIDDRVAKAFRYIFSSKKSSKNRQKNDGSRGNSVHSFGKGDKNNKD